MLPVLQDHAVVLLEQPLAPDPDPDRDLQDLLICIRPAPYRWWRTRAVGISTICCAWRRWMVNLKLLKTGGLSQACLMARVAQHRGLHLMVGCYSDSRLLNGCGPSLIRWPIWTVNLNLIDDPFAGLEREGDRLLASADVGLGIHRRNSSAALADS